MDQPASLRRAKKRHRSGQGLGRVGTGFAALSILLLAFCLVSIGVCAWILKKGQVEIRVAGLPFLSRPLSSVSAVADAVRSVVLDDRDLSVPGTLLIQSVLPSRDPVGEAERVVTGLEASPEPAVEMLPVLRSVGQVMSSGVLSDPLQTVSSQMPSSLARGLQESQYAVDFDGFQLLSLGDLKPVSSGWFVRTGAVPAGAKATSSQQFSASVGEKTYREPVAQIVSLARPQVQGVRRYQPQASPTVIGDTHVYGQNPVVAIYHTHSSEAYQASHGSAYLWGSTDGVVTIGQVLAESLWNEFGIPVVHSVRFHDVDEFQTAYSKSALTAETLVSRYPELRLVLDIHRDATGNDSGAVVTVGGVRAARVLILVTTDKYGLPHPNWRRNLAVAQQIQSVFDSLYPGLSKGVRQHNDGRFNQHIHPGSLLLEVGDVNNTREEAENSALCIARVIAAALSSEI